MNSLAFIKQHVPEWCDDCASVSLSYDGYVVFYDSDREPARFTVDLSEHFAPDYYDGKVYTREEFEAFGVEKTDTNLVELMKVKGVKGLSSNSEHVIYNVHSGEFNTWNRKSLDGLALDNWKHVCTIAEFEEISNEPTPVDTTVATTVSSNKYEREISDRQGNSATVDVYDVLKAFDVTCPATQHALKKLLCTGMRGHKDTDTDLIEARESITRAIELRG